MKFFVIMLLSITLSSQTIFADPVANPCALAGVTSLVIKDFPEWGAGDQCTNEVLNRSPEFLKLIQKIGAVNTRVAATLGSTLAEIFNTPLRIVIKKETFGNLASFSLGAYILIGEFKEFTADLFNEGVYAHELTHWIARKPDTQIRLTLGDKINRFLFNEMIADWVSMTTFNTTEIGMTAYPGIEVPRCMLSIREELNFGLASRFFAKGHSVANLNECCIKIAPTSESVAGLCKEVAANMSKLPDMSDPAFAEPFSATFCSKFSCDSHQVGAALVSFLLKAQKLTTENLLLTFWRGLDLDGLPVNRIQLLEAAIPPALKPEFNNLWTAYVLSVLDGFTHSANIKKFHSPLPMENF